MALVSWFTKASQHTPSWTPSDVRSIRWHPRGPHSTVSQSVGPDATREDRFALRRHAHYRVVLVFQNHGGERVVHGQQGIHGGIIHVSLDASHFVNAKLELCVERSRTCMELTPKLTNEVASRTSNQFSSKQIITCVFSSTVSNVSISSSRIYT